LSLNNRSGDLIQEIWSEADVFLERDGCGHRQQHAKRVLDLCLKIAQQEGKGDLLILQAAAILHDVALLEGDRRTHPKRGAEMAKEILEKVNFPDEKIQGVLYAIETHQFTDCRLPDTVEARILQDADGIDAIGAIGVARSFAVGGRRNWYIYNPSETPDDYDPKRDVSSLTHIQGGLLEIKDKLHTATAKKIAEERHEFMLIFVERLKAEIQGKK
jgi:uncharacterized protein